ncbi:MAG TPA: hypothetical protein PK867_21135 [Pirellulales bacterium]|nr:hypothetical protein [Pirellulales bacterium]
MWVSAGSAGRQDITFAAGEVDDLLQNDPQAHGESRERGRRIMFVAPLAVTFRVDIQARKAEVLRVRKYR